MRRTVFMVCGTAVLLALLTGTANATPAIDGCPSGYAPATLGQLMETPEVEAALEVGFYDAKHVSDVFEMLDANEDGLVCWKSVANDGNTNPMVYYAGRYVENHVGPEK